MLEKWEANLPDVLCPTICVLIVATGSILKYNVAKMMVPASENPDCRGVGFRVTGRAQHPPTWLQVLGPLETSSVKG